MIFLTFNDNTGGIYTSQVIDVVKLLNQTERTYLVAFVSWKKYKETKKEIKSLYSHSFVFPIFAGLKRWRMNKFLLTILNKKLKQNSCIARGPLACELALNSNFGRICYDGRAAVKAEIEEFDVVGDPALSNDFIMAEKKAVVESDYRIAVTKELTKFWEDNYGYYGSDHIIIPCTLSKEFESFDQDEVERLREKLELLSDDVVFVFAGGNAGWNSLKRTFDLFRPRLKENSKYKLLLLTGESEYINQFKNEFPSQVQSYWVNHNQVRNYLALGDYGLLIREDMVTNNVASPVKYAEYLSLGLNVLISDNIKDYTEFTMTHKCGVVISNEIPVLDKVKESERKRNAKLAMEKLAKSSNEIKAKYADLLKILE